MSNIDYISKDKIKLYSDIYNAIKLQNCSFYHKLDCEIEYYYKLLDSFNASELEDYNEVAKFLNARYHKKSRIYKRIEYMLNNYSVCYFCTFTFKKEYVNLSIKYTKDVLCSMLKTLNTCYLGNLDYGEKRGRPHYHVIIAENDVHICKDNVKWGYGWYDLKVIYNKDSVRLGSYIMKLVNHATKATTKDSIITPRGKWSFNKIMKNCD